MYQISGAVLLAFLAAFLACLDPANSVGRLHPTHTKTDTFSALKELIFGKFNKSGLTTFVNRLDGAGPILYKTYQRPPQKANAGTEAQSGLTPNLNSNYDLLGIGWKKTGANRQATATEQPRPGLAGLATRIKNKKIEIKNHLQQKIDTKHQFKKNVLGQAQGLAPGQGFGPFQGLAPGQGQPQSESQVLAAGQVPGGSSEIQPVPGSAEYERLKQYHLMGVVDMYRPPPGEAAAPTGYGWGWDSGSSAAAPTRNKMKPKPKPKKKKKKKIKKMKKKKQKKIKKKKKMEKKKKKKIKQKKPDEESSAAAAAPSLGTGWAALEPDILPVGSAARPSRLPQTAVRPVPIAGSNERTVIGSIGSRVTSTYKVKNRRKSVAPKRKVAKHGQQRQEISLGRQNSKITRTEIETGSLPALSRRSNSEAVLSSRLGLAADSSSAEGGVSYEDYDAPTQPFYGSYMTYYRVPNYRYRMF